MTKKIYFLMNRCLGCEECVQACAKEHDWLAHGHIEWVKKVYPIQIRCSHCEDPACLKSCPVEAIEKREDGIVLINQEKCIGCKNCMYACPFGIPMYDLTTKKVYKCDMCYKRIDSEQIPACVENCPANALLFGDDAQEVISVKPKAMKRTVKSNSYLEDIKIAQEG